MDIVPAIFWNGVGGGGEWWCVERFDRVCVIDSMWIVGRIAIAVHANSGLFGSKAFGIVW